MRTPEHFEPARHLAAWDARAVKLHTTCGDGNMAWRAWGEGPPLLLVHGGAGSWNHWVRNLPEWSDSWTVIVPDLPGLGESAAPPHPYTPESIAEIVAQGLPTVLGRLGRDAGRLDICGFSFGGMICGLVAERLTGRLPGHVGRLVLIGASGLGGRFADLAPVYKLPAAAGPAELEAIHRRNLSTMMLHRPSSIDGLALHIQAVNAPRTRVMSPRDALSDKLEQSLRRTGLGFDSIWGAHCIFEPDLARRRGLLRSIHPRSRFHVVPDAGHWVQYEAAPAVNRIVRECLGASSRASSGYI